MVTTDAYAFLDIDRPLCAWATYRGALVSAPDRPGFISVWNAGLLTASPDRKRRELGLEKVRFEEFPCRVSRLKGMFCLQDTIGVERALAWDEGGRTHFQQQYVAELSLAGADDRRDLLDANWITHFGHLDDVEWMRSYWAGAPCPADDPLWEMLVEGRMMVLGTELRQRAYDLIKSEFPDSLMFLEIARQAAWVDSDLGSISCYIRNEGDNQILSYLLNMEDAECPILLQKLTYLKESGHSINWADLAPHLANDSFGRVPDLRPYESILPP